MNGHVLLVTGAAPYLGGPQTWQPLRDAALELTFRDLDLLALTGSDDFLSAVRTTIEKQAQGARAIVAHGAIAGIALASAEQSGIPVVLLSPIAVTKDSAILRALRALLTRPVGRALITAAARSKRQKLLADPSYIRRQLELLVRSDRISNALVQEARERVADSRMDALIERTPQSLCALLTPNSSFERFTGTCFFGSGPIDRKVRKRIDGTSIESAWSAPMLEAPEVIANHLRTMREGF
jgi:hypothetical protein